MGLLPDDAREELGKQSSLAYEASKDDSDKQKVTLTIPNVVLQGLFGFTRDGKGVDGKIPYDWQGDVVDITRASLIRYLITAHGYNDDYGKGSIPQLAHQLYHLMQENKEACKVVNITTRSIAFANQSAEDMVDRLIQGMIYEGIPIPYYFDGMSLLKRALFTDTERAEFLDLKKNHLEIGKLEHGIEG